MKKILVVDDSPTMRNLVKSLVETKGYAADTAENGAQGVEVFEKMHPDLVIADINMPVMNGIDMIKALRTKQERATVPVIVLTTETSPTIKQKLRDVGASAWIAKPYDDSVLIDMVASFLN